MAVNKIWNNRIIGIPSMLFVAISIMMQRIADIITSFFFRCNIASCGKRVHVGRGVAYRYPNNIIARNNIIIGKHVEFSSEVLQASHLTIENGVSIGDNCHIDFSGGVIMEEGAHLAHHVRITTHDHGYDHHNRPIGKSLKICKNAFVGDNVIVLFNCNTIGENSVIGAGSIVTKDVPDNAIVAGNPARIIKYINYEDTVI